MNIHDTTTTMEVRAEEIGAILLDHSPTFVAEATLVAATGLVGYAVRWYIFQLRRAGFVIETAMLIDREAFNHGVRGWRLVDVCAPTPSRAPQIGTPEVPQKRVRSTRVASKLAGEQVHHAVYGVGSVVFERPGFPKVSVNFAGRVEKVGRNELEPIAK